MNLMGRLITKAMAAPTRKGLMIFSIKRAIWHSQSNFITARQVIAVKTMSPLIFLIFFLFRFITFPPKA